MAKDLNRFLKKKINPDEFTRKVIEFILKIPRGKVATYGQIAELAGKANCSRQVGFILRTVIKTDTVPWQRVLGADGKIAFPKRNKNFKIQRRRLEGEGITFTGARVDLDRYRWRRRPKDAGGRARPRMFSY